MISTIQLSDKVKETLALYKNSPKESYEEVIINLIKLAETQKRNRDTLLIEECKEMAEENLRIAREGEGALMDGMDKNERWEY
jgi:predicted CopG family antitoxin